MHRLADFAPLWEALGVKDGREYCRNRTRRAIIRRQTRINEAVQRAARYSFLFRSAVVDIDWVAVRDSTEKRIEELGGSKLTQARAQMELRLQHVAEVTDGPDDPRFQAASARARRQYENVLTVYERAESDERRRACAMVDDLMEDLLYVDETLCEDEAFEHLDGQVSAVCLAEIVAAEENYTDFDAASDPGL